MRFNRSSLLTALVFLVAAPLGAAHGSDVPSDVDLRGIDGLRVTLSALPPEAGDCRLDGASLVRNLEQGLNAGGLRTASDDEAVATVTVLSSYEPEHCSSSVMLGAYRKVSFFDHEVGWLRTGYVVLWQSGVLVTSAPERHLDGIRDALGRLGNGLLEDWRQSNQDRAPR